MTSQSAASENIFCVCRIRQPTEPGAPLATEVDGTSMSVQQEDVPGATVSSSSPASLSSSSAPPGSKRLRFRLDNVLPPSATQEDVFLECGAKVVDRALAGINGTILAYGQTGAGKTYTMTGGTEGYAARGLCPRVVAHLFERMEALQAEQPGRRFVVRASYLEVYNERLFDLLHFDEAEAAEEAAAASLTIVEASDGSTEVRGLRLPVVASRDEAIRLLFEGETNRAIAEHKLNAASTRSHCVFTLHVQSFIVADDDDGSGGGSGGSGAERCVASKLNLVDRAGSERPKRTESTRGVLREARYINKSLSFLEQVVVALTDKTRTHVPFRQSKLTHALRDSLGGNCCTLMIACVRPELSHAAETTATLRFASRMRQVACVPVVNVRGAGGGALGGGAADGAAVRQLRREVAMLREELAMHDVMAGRAEPVLHDAAPSGGGFDAGQRQAVRQRVQHYVFEAPPVPLPAPDDDGGGGSGSGSGSSSSAEQPRAGRLVFHSVQHVHEIFDAFRELVLSHASASAATARLGGTDGSPSGVAVAAAAAAAVPTEASRAPALPPHSSQRSSAVTALRERCSNAAGSPPPHPATKAAAREQKPPPAVASSSNSGVVGGSSSSSSSSSSRSSRGAAKEQAPPLSLEEFKRGPGAEHNARFLQAKADLRQTRERAKALSVAVNGIKGEIDRTLAAIGRRKEEQANARPDMLDFGDDDDDGVSGDGDQVAQQRQLQQQRQQQQASDSEMTALVSALKEAKQRYRAKFGELAAVKEQLSYLAELKSQRQAEVARAFESLLREGTGDGGKATAASANSRTSPGAVAMARAPAKAEQAPPQSTAAPAAAAPLDMDAETEFDAQQKAASKRRKSLAAAATVGSAGPRSATRRWN